MKTVAPLASGFVAVVLLMQAKPSEFQPIENNIIAKYKLLGAEYGSWNYHETGFTFRPGKNIKKTDLPGFRFELGPDSDLPDSNVPFGLELPDRTTDSSLKHLKLLRNLSLLDLGGTNVTDDGMRELVHLKNLKMLSISNNNITNAGIKELSRLKGLVSLLATDTKLSDEGMADLARFKELSYLSLGPNVSDTGLKELANLKNLTTLIIKSGNATISDAGIKHLLSLEKVTTLQLLCPTITSTGVKELARLKSLRRLIVYYADEFTEDDAQKLASLKQLKTLELLGEMKAATLKGLRKALPKCDVHCLTVK